MLAAPAKPLRQGILNTGSLLKAAEMLESKQPQPANKLLDSSDEEKLKEIDDDDSDENFREGAMDDLE